MGENRFKHRFKGCFFLTKVKKQVWSRIAGFPLEGNKYSRQAGHSSGAKTGELRQYVIVWGKISERWQRRYSMKPPKKNYL
jgi:hypothetical protein